MTIYTNTLYISNPSYAENMLCQCQKEILLTILNFLLEYYLIVLLLKKNISCYLFAEKIIEITITAVCLLSFFFR